MSMASSLNLNERTSSSVLLLWLTAVWQNRRTSWSSVAMETVVFVLSAATVGV